MGHPKFPVDTSVFDGTLFEKCPVKLWWIDTTMNKQVKMDTPDRWYYYKPFSVTVAYAVPQYDRMTNCRIIVHDIAHMLDIFMKGKTNKLLEPEMGYKFLNQNEWSARMWENEVNVLAMQTALLTGDNFKDCESYYREAVLGYLFDNIKESDREQLRKSMEHIRIQKHIFGFWKNNSGYLKNMYTNMCNWIRNHEYFNKQVA